MIAGMLWSDAVIGFSSIGLAGADSITRVYSAPYTICHS